ncbi:NADH-quinone oxidoreductase subunit J [Andreprevotia lacus DSM 23236]|jgi:NADH-quinone oxidoreductase subunit J|uniref:NADH-quinone oxidoreductase subunit J n=1 Tax=Andreprevotia lacus DSM 23236 TaxID=1121001 RepID=A0A1W1X0E2_9NEIS|nr:NADH-quinone oxidoreductase subunit J [Andreprevotia lacus]SMC17178.1 NADH-quinone oxidoreductase subunit J [Andreprevotia lacus DSM 23236]
MTELVIFYSFALILVFAAFRVITAKNPVHAALYLVLSFFTGAVLWMLTKAEFLAVSLIVIYVGAVMVLFLFVVMMLDINFEELRKGFWRYLPVAGTVAVLMAYEMVMVLTHPSAQLRGAAVAEPAAGYNNAKVLGQLIYTQYFLPFQLAAVLLLVGMVAAIALTLRKRKNTKYINPADQIKVKRDERLTIVSVNAEARAVIEPPKPADGEQQA